MLAGELSAASALPSLLSARRRRAPVDEKVLSVAANLGPPVVLTSVAACSRASVSNSVLANSRPNRDGCDPNQPQRTLAPLRDRLLQAWSSVSRRFAHALQRRGTHSRPRARGRSGLAIPVLDGGWQRGNDLDMDPITVIVAAVAAGASAGLKDAAAAAVKDAYSALKRLIAEHYGHVDVEGIERRPDSDAKRRSLEEDLRGSGVDPNQAVLDAATRVLEEVKKHSPGTGAAIGIDLDHFHAASLRIRDVQASGTGVRVHEGTFTGDVDIQGVRAGGAPPSEHP